MLINFLFSNPLLFVVLVSALFMSLSLHEFAHAFVAFKLGDPTAKSAGRLTVNPLAHMDPIGTMLLLFAGFGWARPVPVNPMFLKNIRRDMAIISFAGPISNFILAGLSALILNVISFDSTLLFSFLYYFALYNIGLGIFNLFPIHPLDGFKIVSGILPENLSFQWEQLAPYGTFILLFMIFTDSFGKILFPLMSFVMRILGLSL